MKKLLSSILAVLMAAALVVTGGFTGFAAASAEQPVAERRFPHGGLPGENDEFSFQIFRQLVRRDARLLQVSLDELAVFDQDDRFAADEAAEFDAVIAQHRQ